MPLASYTTRNSWFASILLVVLASHVSCLADLLAGIRAHDHLGYEGEVAELGIALLLLLTLYLVPFAIETLSAALRRGSKSISGRILLLALFPIMLVGFTCTGTLDEQYLKVVK